MTIRRWLERVLPDDAWSREFLDELDRDAERRGAGVWWRAVVSGRTWHFVGLMWKRHRKRTKEGGRMGGLDGWWKDLSHAGRIVTREGRLTLFVALTLAVGIGGTAAMYGIADRLYFGGPEHVHEPDRLARLYLEFEEDQNTPGRTTPWIPEAAAYAGCCPSVCVESSQGRFHTAVLMPVVCSHGHQGARRSLAFLEEALNGEWKAES